MLNKEEILICVVASPGNGRESLAVSIGEFLRSYAGEIEYDPISVMVNPEKAEFVLDSGFYKAKQLKIMTDSSMVNWTEVEDSLRSDILEWLEHSGRSMTSDSSDVEDLLSHIRKILEQ